MQHENMPLGFCLL